MPIDALGTLVRDALIRVGQPSNRDGLFSINLSSRYRWYLAPARLVIMMLAAIAWDVARTMLVWQDVQSIEMALNQVLERDRALMKEAQQVGIDLSEAAVQLLP